MLEGTFNQEEALSRSLVRDCEIFANLRLTFVSSSTGQLQLALDTRDRLEPVILEQERDLGPAPAPADQAPDNGSTKVLPQTHSNNFKFFYRPLWKFPPKVPLKWTKVCVQISFCFTPTNDQVRSSNMWKRKLQKQFNGLSLLCRVRKKRKAP